MGQGERGDGAGLKRGLPAHFFAHHPVDGRHDAFGHLNAAISIA